MRKLYSISIRVPTPENPGFNTIVLVRKKGCLDTHTHTRSPSTATPTAAHLHDRHLPCKVLAEGAEQDAAVKRFNRQLGQRVCHTLQPIVLVIGARDGVAKQQLLGVACRCTDVARPERVLQGQHQQVAGGRRPWCVCVCVLSMGMRAWG